MPRAYPTFTISRSPWDNQPYVQWPSEWFMNSMIETSRKAVDSADIFSLAAELRSSTTPAASYHYIFSDYPQASMSEARTIIQLPEKSSPSTKYSTSPVDAMSAPISTPASSLQSRGVSKSLRDESLQAIARASPRYICNKSGYSRRFSLQHQLK